MDHAGVDLPPHLGVAALAFCAGLLWRPAPPPVHLHCLGGEAVELQQPSFVGWAAELGAAIAFGLLIGWVWTRCRHRPRSLFDA